MTHASHEHYQLFRRCALHWRMCFDVPSPALICDAHNCSHTYPEETRFFKAPVLKVNGAIPGEVRVGKKSQKRANQVHKSQVTQIQQRWFRGVPRASSTFSFWSTVSEAGSDHVLSVSAKNECCVREQLHQL